jgi:hypothetical protein
LESGTVLMIVGGVVSDGPPLGGTWPAHPTMSIELTTVMA